MCNVIFLIFEFIFCLCVCTVQAKLQWLCDEVHVYEAREKKMAKMLQQCREEMKMLKQRRELEQHSMQDRITQLELLLEKKGTDLQNVLSQQTLL